MATGWYFPGTVLCAVLGWLSVLLFCAALRNGGPSYRGIFLAGAVLYTGGFYWLLRTISDFGGFNLFTSSAIFALFIVGSALQFPLWLLIYRFCPPFLKRLDLAAGISWILAQMLAIRIFPWEPGHTQLALVELAQLASLGGVPLITLLMFWVSELLLGAAFNSPKSGGSARVRLATFLLLSTLIYGYSQRIEYSHTDGKQRLKVALVQANISISEKHNQKFFEANTERYRRLSEAAAENDIFMVWPEAVIQDWIPANVGSVESDPHLPHFSAKTMNLLLGALTYDSRESFHNSAVAVLQDGSVPYPYHKQILMPFGEFTPLKSVLPWLESIHPTPDFTPGNDVTVFNFSSGDGGQFTAAPLICYEDVIPGLSRRAVQKGADILVNLTNDAWFGDSVAPYQHHMIASFRAIENRRFLLRSTNSGYTSVVDPLGRTVGGLPNFSEGVLKSEITLERGRTFFTRYLNLDRQIWR